MSGFFRNVSSSSSSSDSSSEDEAPKVQQKAKKNFVSSFMPSDSEEDVKRVVRSAKDKRYEEIKENIRKARNYIKINDFSALETQFDNVKNVYKKASSVINKEGGSTPRFYLRFLYELEQFVDANWGDRKKMSSSNSKGINILRQNLRKYIKESVERDLNAYKESPDPEGYTSTEVAGDDDQEASELSDNDDVHKIVAPSKRRAYGSDEEDWSESESSSSSDSDLSDLEAKDMEALRRYFLKAEYRGEGEVEKEKQKAEAKKQRKREKQKEKEALRKRLLEDDEEGWIHTGEKERPKLFEKDAKITYDMVMAKFGEICMQRGKKLGQRNTMLDNLVELMEVTKNLGMGPALHLKILLQIVQFTFEHNMKISDCMQYEMWESCIRYTNEILELLTDTPNLIFHTNMSDEEEKLILTEKDPDQQYRIGGSLVTLIESLDNEYTKILQQADNHSNDYIIKLKGRPSLCSVIDRALNFMQSRAEIYTQEELCRVYMRAIEQIYYEFEPASARDAAELGAVIADGEETKREKLARYCKFVYAHDTSQRMLQRTALCQIYHHALHDYWDEARDLMLMSHIQNNIDKSDVPAQILYNRCICQLGLCAFRQGHIEKAYQALIEIHQQGPHRPGPKELLGQGLAPNRYDQRTEAQEKLERQQQIPYHMHISIELMECVFLICSMLLDIPSLGTRDYDIRKRNLSRLLFNQLRQSERTTLLGPAETPREHVVAASRAMLEGDWQKTCTFIVNEKMNSKVWKLFRRRDQVTSMVLTQVKEACLKSYLLRGATVYISVSLSFLSQMFELEQTVVHSIVSRLIINDELAASIDEPTQCVVMHRQQPTKLQMAALQLAERLNQLADANESILDPRTTNQYGRQGGAFGDRRGVRQDREQRGEKQEGGGFGDNKRVDFKNVFNNQRGSGRGDNRRGEFQRGSQRAQNVR